MQQGDQVEVLEPASLRDQMRNLAKTLTSYYKD
jgi:predicted DNA-binding transcriptional regulator YafY